MKSLTIFVDGRQYASARDMHLALKMLLNLPEHYGCNADALYDCLTEITVPTAVGMVFPYTDFDEEDHDLIAYYDKIKRVFRDADEDNGQLAVFIFERY